jgi:hypothetical protein
MAQNSTNTKKISAKLASLEMEYSIVLKMYEEAYKNYSETLKDSVSAIEEDPCGVYSSSSTNVSQECYNKVWKDAGCTTVAQNVTSDYLKSQTLDGLKTDSSLWTTINDDTHKIGCYGSTDGKSTGVTTDTSNLASLKGYTFWGKRAVSSTNATTDSDCKTSCANNSKCTGATFNTSKQLCWIRTGNGEISEGLSDDYAIVPKLKQQAYILQQLNEKLTKLNTDIVTEMVNDFGQNSSSSSSSSSSLSTNNSSGLMQYAGLFKPSEASIRLNKLSEDKKQIDDAINQLEGVNQMNGEFADSFVQVKQARIFYMILCIVALALIAFASQNGTFGKIIAVIIIMILIIIISISTS